jgi:RNA polymerase sigma-70 factor (ECF subfamily)
MELFAAHQRRLFLYISAIIPSPADAEEVLQETNIVIWKKFDQFKPDAPGSDFLAWAYRIAYYQALDHRRRMARSAAAFSPQVMDQLHATAQHEGPTIDTRRRLLDLCMAKLPDHDRQLIEDCYAPNASVAGIAEQTRRTATSVYRSLRRIRRALSDCVTRQLKAQEA